MTSIRRHLTRRLAILTFLIATGGLLAIFFYLRIELHEQFDITLASRARTLGSLVHVDADTGLIEFELSEASMVEYRQTDAPGDPDYFQIWQTAGGAVVARSVSLGNRDLPHAPSATPFKERTRFFNLTLPDGRAGRAVEYLVEPGHEQDPDGTGRARHLATSPGGTPMVTLVLATDPTSVNEVTRHVLGMLIIVITAVSLGTMYAVVRTVRIGLTPLRKVGDDVSQIGPTSLTTRVGEQGLPEELQPIADKLNELLGRLDAAFQRERRFTSNVAHELRTPIAELRTLAEVAIKWPSTAYNYDRLAADAGVSAPPAAGSFQDVLTISREMEAVVGALLSIARSEAGQQALTLSEVELSEVVADSWRPHAATSDARDLQVQLDLPPTTVLSDRAALAAMVGNLLANAVTYTPVGGRVDCRIARTGDRCTLVVSNTNTRLSPADLPMLTEPFWRKDPARTESKNSGLGLTLVATYAKLLDVNFTVALPSPDVFAAQLEMARVDADGAGPHDPAIGGATAASSGRP